jgi:thiol:disulfide interchange protein
MIKFWHVLFWLSLCGSAFANPVQRPHTLVQLVSESASIAPGQSVTLAIRMTPIAKWHTYYKNYGDSGIETSANWSLPQGFVAGGLAFPTPSRIAAGTELMNFGYEAPSVLLVQLQAPAQLVGDVFPVSLQLNWLVCSDEICVPEDAVLRIRLLRGEGAANPAHVSLFAQAREAMPKPVAWPVRYAVDRASFRIEAVMGAEMPEISEAYFYPTPMSIMANATPQKFRFENGTLRLETASALQGVAPNSLDGVFAFKTKGNDSIEGFAVKAELIAALPALAATENDVKPLTPLLAIGFAFLGGVLLNLMPCVFPILSLKALTLAKSGGAPRQAQTEALWYSIGVVATFVALAALLYALRAAGQSIGWGFQLQDARVVGVLALLMVLVALNLFGVFEVHTRFAGVGQELTQAKGSRGAFWTGALAVIVATPCTAPFMAGALGAAFALPPLIGLLIFISLGLGMALPFLLLGYVPMLRRWLPKPGAWMATFKTLLGFPMLATAIWLLWVAGQQAGLDAAITLLGAGLLIGFGAWLIGRGQASGGRAWLAVLGAATVVGAGALAIGLPSSAASSTPKTLAFNAAPYSEAALAKAQASGKPVFVYFTADWCISCKVNERTTLADAAVQQAFADRQTTILVGDWTKRDDVIAKTLARYGRSGVPLYLWFPSGAADAQILPQLLTPDQMLKTIRTS